MPTKSHRAKSAFALCLGSVIIHSSNGWVVGRSRDDAGFWAEEYLGGGQPESSQGRNALRARTVAVILFSFSLLAAAWLYHQRAAKTPSWNSEKVASGASNTIDLPIFRIQFFDGTKQELLPQELLPDLPPRYLMASIDFLRPDVGGSTGRWRERLKEEASESPAAWFPGYRAAELRWGNRKAIWFWFRDRVQELLDREDLEKVEVEWVRYRIWDLEPLERLQVLEVFDAPTR